MTPPDEHGSGETDETLMERVVSEECREAYSILVRRYFRRVLVCSFRILGNWADAEEVTQETFLRVWKKAASWAAGGNPWRAWLYRIAINLCYDRLRRATLVREVPMDADTGALADTRQDAEGEALAREREAMVAMAVAALPDRQRVALSLCYYEGLSNRMTAAVMGVGAGAVESLLVRARRQLRERLCGYGRDGQRGGVSPAAPGGGAPLVTPDQVAGGSELVAWRGRVRMAPSAGTRTEEAPLPRKGGLFAGGTGKGERRVREKDLECPAKSA